MRVEEEVIRRVNELAIVKEAGSDYFFHLDWENFISGEVFSIISVFISYRRKTAHGQEESISATAGMVVLKDTISQFKVQHSFIINDGKQTIVRTTEVRNQYGSLVEHLVDAFNSAIKSIIHYFKTGEQLNNHLS